MRHAAAASPSAAAGALASQLEGVNWAYSPNPALAPPSDGTIGADIDAAAEEMRRLRVATPSSTRRTSNRRV